MGSHKKSREDDDDKLQTPCTSKKYSELTHSGSDSSVSNQKERSHKSQSVEHKCVSEFVKTNSLSHGRNRKRKRQAKKQSRREPRAKRRKVVKRKPTPRVQRRRRPAPSVSTIYTKLSYDNESDPGCDKCGHHCCKRSRRGTYHYCKESSNGKNDCKIRKKEKECQNIQVGARCLMLSPLFVTTNENPSTNTNLEKSNRYVEVSLEMICKALKDLGKWSESVSIAVLCSYLKRTKPVNPDEGALFQELRGKLEIASKLDLVEYIGEDKWMLMSSFTVLQETHLTRFWEMYGDTMTPISKGQKNKEPENNDKKRIPKNSQDVSNMYL